MTSPDTRIAEIRARLAAATPGPWEVHHPQTRYHIIAATLPAGEDFVLESNKGVGVNDPADADFIANAPTDIAYLLDTYLPDQIARAVEAERDACAAIAEIDELLEGDEGHTDIARSIRARGVKA